MPLATCRRCKQMFDKVGSPICPACMPDEEADYDRVHQILEAGSDQSPEQVAKAAGVSVACVMRMIDDGRIASAATIHGVKCGRCGAPAISVSKKLCEKCLAEIDRNLTAAKQKIRASDLDDQDEVDFRQVEGDGGVKYKREGSSE